jgi:geranylgeranylglycerol-phosphate geranylgeranyltransferase
MPLTLRNIHDLIIPNYLLITVLSPIASALISEQAIPNFGLLSISIMSLSLAMLGFNTLNMIFDGKLDAINKPLRPIPSGRVSLTEAKAVALTLYLASFILATLTQWTFIVILIAFIVISLMYTLPEIYLKRYFGATPIIGSIIYGVVPFLTGWSVTTKELPIIFLIFFTFLIMSISILKDLEDIVGEKKYGIQNIPAKIGEKNTIYTAILGISLALIGILAVAIFNIVSFKYVIPTILSIVLLIITAKKNFLKTKTIKNEKIVTQSKIVTSGFILIIAIQLIYGMASIVA